MSRRAKPQELLRLDEIDAWLEYREATRNVIGYRYEEVEVWAWVRLRERLQVLRRRRKAAEA